jgi:signal transduction histidine kinase
MVDPIEKRTWNWLDTVLFLIRTAWILFNGLINVIPLYSDPSKKSLLVVWFLAIYIVPYLFYRPGFVKFHYYLAMEFLLTGSMFLFMVIEFHEAGPDILSMICFPLLTIAFASQTRPFVWIAPLVSLLLVMGGMMIGGFFGDGSVMGRIVDISMFYVFGFALGRVALINNSRKLLIESIEEKNVKLEIYSKENEEKNRTLEQYAKRIEELTIIEERNRVSKDMHDTVGHIFTTVITRLDALPFLIKANKNKTDLYIKEISNLARKGLDDVRNTIHQLSSDEGNNSLQDLGKNLVDDFVKHTGTEVDLEVQGIEQEIGERVKYSLIRVLQESLTNAKRHGHSTKIHIRLQFTDESIILDIQDNGIGSDHLTPGFGLNSMKDRLIMLGGSFHIESKQQEGTRIRCKIPLPKEEVMFV